MHLSMQLRFFSYKHLQIKICLARRSQLKSIYKIQLQKAADLRKKTIYLGLEYVCRLLSSTPTTVIYLYYL